MTFEAVIDSSVVQPADRGTLRIVVENGAVTHESHTGVFAGLSVPPVGSSGNFEFVLPGFDITYDLPGTPGFTHDVALSLDGGAHEDEFPVDNVFDECTLVTDIGNGFDGASTSAPRPPDPGMPGDPGDIDLGFNARHNVFHVAIPLEIPSGPFVELDAILVPIFQVGAPPGIATIQAAYTRLWSGDPMSGGVVIGGDMVIDRLETDLNGDPDVEADIDIYRVPQNTPTNVDRRVQETLVGLDHLPLLAPGSYYLELAFEGAINLPDPEVVPCPWKEADDHALVYDVVTDQWQLARDSQSQRIVDFCGTVFAANTGACCLANNGCMLNQTRVDCVEIGGRYLGDGSTSCSHDAQGNCIPTISEWGAAVLTLLLLIAATLCMARRRVVTATTWPKPT